MEFGIFESVVMRNSLEETFAAVVDRGFTTVQFDLASAGLPSLPDRIDPLESRRIARAAASAGLGIAALSGTFNMAHPDVDRRAADLKRLEVVVECAPVLGCSVVTLCTGTRNRESMWRRHPGNEAADAWSDFRQTLDTALEIAARQNVQLGVEPEPANVISSVERATRLLREVNDDHLKIIFDPANIVLSDRRREPSEMLEHAFAELGEHVVHAHAKDLSAEGEFCAAGTGIVPWRRYRELLEDGNYQGPVIFHTLSEEDIPLARSVMEP